MRSFKQLYLSLIFLTTLTSGIASTKPVEIIAAENDVEASNDGKTWVEVDTGEMLDYGSRVRTGEFSRVALRFPSGNVIRLSEFSNITLSRPSSDREEASAKTQLKEGAMHFFSRYRDSETDVATPSVVAAIRGTEFEIRVLPDQSTEFTLFEGSVVLENEAGSITLAPGERGRAEINRAPIKIPMIDASRHIQWYLYYPAILDPDSMILDQESLQASLTAYREGDLLGALEALPEGIEGGMDASIYFAGLVLSSGQVDNAQSILGKTTNPSATALQELIDTVKGREGVPSGRPQGAAGWLARSYTLQAYGDLEGAFAAALRATEIAPELGYAWARVSRLYFSMGRIDDMQRSLETAQSISPQNAEVHTLYGFAKAASGDYTEAITSFERAISIAPAYADAWLGLGLVRFKENAEADALKNLLAAAALEPNRSILRSYLGKGFAEAERDRFTFQASEASEKALHELTLAQQLDPADPTPWLYSALLKQDDNRPIEAIQDLNESIRLNDNRSLFRSSLLIDVDLAVRRSNLAEIYQEAGLPTQALTEAGKAITGSYLNFSAHDFIANAYTPRLDPTGLAQRYDTVVANELFLRNILAPVGAGLASQVISEQEFSSLFQQKGISGSASAFYDSRERSEFTFFGTYTDDKFAIGIELLRREWNELDFNDEYLKETAQVQLKFEPSTKDRVYLNILYNTSEQDDVRQITKPDAAASRIHEINVNSDGRTVFNPRTNNQREINGLFGRDPELEINTWQEPLIFLSYGREWNPEQTSLILLGHTDLRREVNDPLRSVISLNTHGAPIQREYDSSFYFEEEFSLQSFELQHIFMDGENQIVLGARYQDGEFKDRTKLLAAIPESLIAFDPTKIDFAVPFTIEAVGSGSTKEDFSRWSAYAYYTRDFDFGLSLIGALTVEGIDFADRQPIPPRPDTRKEEELFAPKLGFIWQLNENWNLRGAWSRSLSGYNIEDQLRLEPTQIAGLVSTFRSLIPTPLTGTVAGGTNDIFTLNLSGKIGDHTFATLETFYGTFEGDRSYGIFEETIPFGEFPNEPDELSVGVYNQDFDYDELSILARIDHLLTDSISVGASTSWQQVQLDETTNSPLGRTSPLLDDTESTLFIGSLYGNIQLPSGWFFGGSFDYWIQDHDIAVELDDARLPMLNLSAGRRLKNQRGRITINVLNITEEDDGLHTLNYFNAPPDERVVTVKLELGF